MAAQKIRRFTAGLAISAFGGMLFAGAAHCQTTQARANDPAPPEQQVTTPAEKQIEDNYVIGDNDLLSIDVWNEPDLKQSLPVRPDGRISLPLIGDVQAAGRTPSELQIDIADKLRAYITHPDVTVVVEQIRSKKFNILGRVMKPGAYPLSSTTTVLDAIAVAGGFQDFAKRKGVYILRPVPGGGENRIPFNYKDVIKGKNLKQNITLEPDDTIVVP